MAIKLDQLHTTDGKVHALLISFPETRDDDKALLTKYIETFNPELLEMTVSEALNQNYYPNIESIMRTRRKLQATFTELQSSKRVKEDKERSEDAYKQYAGE